MNTAATIVDREVHSWKHLRTQFWTHLNVGASVALGECDKRTILLTEWTSKDRGVIRYERQSIVSRRTDHIHIQEIESGLGYRW